MEENNSIKGLKLSEEYELMAYLLKKFEQVGIQDGIYPEIKETKDGLLSFSVMKSKVDLEELNRLKTQISGVKVSISHGNKYSFRIVVEGTKAFFLDFLSQSRASSATHR